MTLSTRLVVVVSEETGQISYAHRGQLVRHVTVQELRAFLSHVLVRRTEPRNWLSWLRPGHRTTAPDRSHT